MSAMVRYARMLRAYVPVATDWHMSILQEIALSGNNQKDKHGEMNMIVL